MLLFKQTKKIAELGIQIYYNRFKHISNINSNMRDLDTYKNFPHKILISNRDDLITNEKEDINLTLEIDSSEMTTSDSFDSFEEVDQKNDEESDLSANDESDADTSLESAESSIVSSSKSESVDILSNVSISSID